MPSLHRTIAFALLLIVLLESAAPAQSRTFASRSRLFPVGPNPSAIVVHDLNDDDLPDIITADRGELLDMREERPANDELSMLLGQGNLEYTKHHPSLKTGFAPYAIAIANIDAIRWPDIIVASFHAVRGRPLNVFLNLHHENIFQPIHIAVPTEGLDYFRHMDSEGNPVFHTPGLTALVVRDIDGDGYRDILATAWASDVIVHVPGQSEDFFGEPRFIPASGGPRDLQVVDLNNNGQLDIVATLHNSNEVALWQGNGSGSFTEVNRFLTRGRLPNKVRVADMNGDGRPDLIVSHRHTDDSLVIFYNDGNMRFSVSQEILLGEHRDVLEYDIRDLVVADLNNNGRSDIAVACAAGSVVVLINEGARENGGMAYRRENYAFSDGKPHAIAAGDLNNNGYQDLAVALWEVNAVGILQNQGG